MRFYLLDLMLSQNEKKAMKSADVCSRLGPPGHMVLPLRLSFTQCLQIHLVLTLCAGFAAAAITATVPTVVASQEVIYLIEVTVDTPGPAKNEQEILDWLQPVLQNNLQTCGVITTTPTTSTMFSTTSHKNYTDHNTTDRITLNVLTTVLADVTPLLDTATVKVIQNNPNANSVKLVRLVRETRSDFDLDLVVNTTCLVTLTLAESVSPCCILQTICSASQASSDINVVGKRAERAGALQANATECSSPSGDVCVYTGPSPTCDMSQSVYELSSSNSTQCPAGKNKCNCSDYCSKSDAYYIFSITTKNMINESILLSILSAVKAACPSCPPEITSNYKDASIACNTETSPITCTVIAHFTQEVPICVLSELVTTLLQVQSIYLNGSLTRAAVCGKPVTGDSAAQLLQSSYAIVNVNIKPDGFCGVIQNFDNCQPEKSVIVKLNEKCALATTVTPRPNTTLPETMNTTVITNSTTLSANETMNTTVITNSTTLSANETMNTTVINNSTTLSANETMNTTVTNSTPTPVNDSTTVAPTTSEDNLAAANALLDMTKDASKLNSSQVDQLVSALENLLSGPNVSMALGNTSVNIVSNLQNATQEALSNSKNRIIAIVSTVGEKLVISETTETIYSKTVALSVKKADGQNFKETVFSISSPSQVQVRSPRATRAVKEDSSIPQGSIRLPKTLTQNLTAEQQQMVSRVQFNFYQKSTLFRILNSGILGASVSNVTISNLEDAIIISLRNLQPIPANYVATCVFWDFTFNDRSGGWNSNGCSVQNSTDNETICACTHLTSFGILLDLSGGSITSRLQATILTFITYIGCGISAIFLAVTLLTYLAFGKLRKDIPSKILIQLCLALLLLNLVFLVDAWLALYPDAVGLCISTAWFLHYFLLVAFTWMGLEAVHMYIALVKVFNSYISRYMVKFSLVGWGIPMIVVIIVIAIDKDNYGLVSYGKFTDGTSDEFCWIKNSVAFYVAVVAYFCVIFLFNIIMFVVVMVQLCRIKRQNPHNLQHRTTFQDVRSVLGITVLLGLTWGFAFFAWGPLNLPFMYLFAIFNSLQGFFIFVFHCAIKENVRRQWRTYLCCGRMRLAENSEWSRTATQKTTKKSSMTRLTSLQSSKSNNSSSSSSYLVSDSFDQTNGYGSPFSDQSITADEDPRMDVVLNEINSNYRRL
ncbi:hypothetical protein WMY93_008409 [Mugilogobius chulae]|uniref:Adhesion G-protein coupled receptor G2 n=1 Tax=Mugilogobius chulae TaxID=88201 RepID=A0AAW0PUS1_9GOBI